MPFFPLGIDWALKPGLGIPIDWRNPVTKGLLAAVINNEGAGNHSFDMAKGQFGGDDNGVTTSSSGPLGRIYASGYYGGERLGPAFSAHVDELTLIIRYATNDVSVVTRNALCTSTASGSDGQWVRNVSGAYEARYTDGFTPKTVTGTTAPANGVFRTVAMTVKKNGYLRLYVDGVEEGTAQTTHASNPIYVSGTFLKVGNKAAGYNTYTNTITVNFAYAFQRELSAREIKNITEAPYSIFQPDTTWVSMAAGGGGTTHEAALTLAASGGLSGGANAAFTASIAFAATGGLSDGATADYAAAWSATATAALVPGGAATMLAALALTGSTGLSASATAGLTAAVAFPAVADVAASYGSIVMAALALDAVGGMTAAVQAQYEAAITAATTAGITPAAAAILSASFQAAVVAALAASTSGMDHEAALGLPCSAALSATTYADLAAAITLATGTTVDAAALATMFAGVAFPVLAALAATHPDDIASAVRVVVMFQTASAQIGFTTKSAKVTIQ